MKAVCALALGWVLIAWGASVRADAPAADATKDLPQPAASGEQGAKPDPNVPPRPAESVEPPAKAEAAPTKAKAAPPAPPKPMTPTIEPPRASSSVLSDEIEPIAPANAAAPRVTSPEQVAAPLADGVRASTVTPPAAPTLATPSANALDDGIAPAPTMPSKAPASTAGRADGWRYQWYQGRWWYYLPNNQWIYFDGTAWQDVLGTNGSAVTANSPVTSDPGLAGAPLAGTTGAAPSGYGYSIAPTLPPSAGYSVFVGPFGRAVYVPSPATNYGWYPGGAYLGFGYGGYGAFVGPNYGIMPGSYGPGWYGR